MMDPMDGHKCEIIAIVSLCERGREAKLGRLLRPIEGYPSETHCLHITTPAKQVVFGINLGDMAAMAVLAQIVHGQPFNQQWLDSMEEYYRHNAEEEA